MGLNIKIGRLKLKNPVILASGTAGFGEELQELTGITKLGAIVTKTITLERREGNSPPRLCETHAGLLNSIGLANSGLKGFLFEKVPYLEKLKIPVIVSIAGESVGEYTKLAEELSRVPCISAIEVNLSCPNTTYKGTKFFLPAQDKKAVYRIISRLRKTTSLTLITKLSPNVTDIKKIAKSAENGGADVISLINTYPAMAVDINTQRPRLGNITGGLSGPAIKPLALKCVWDVYNSVKIPLVGMGGIMNAEDAIEFILCGATCVQIGTATFVDPEAPYKILKGIEKYLKEKKIDSIDGLRGKLKI